MDLRKIFAFCHGQIVIFLFVFIHIPALNVIFFFFVLAPPRLFSSPATMGRPLRRIICRAFSASVWTFVNFFRATLWGYPVLR